MKYRDRTVVEEYVYLCLKRFVADEKAHGRSLYKRDLLVYAEQIFKQVESNILRIIERGRRIKAVIPRDRYVIMATVGERSGRRCFIICEDDCDGATYVIALQTSSEFNRKHRRRFRRGKADYRSNPAIRRGVILH